MTGVSFTSDEYGGDGLPEGDASYTYVEVSLRRNAGDSGDEDSGNEDSGNEDLLVISNNYNNCI
jgi:hypothetical protein